VPEQVNKIFFFRNSPKFLTKKEIFPNSLPFSMFRITASPAYLQALKGVIKNEIWLFNCQTSQKRKERQLQSLFRESCVTAPKTISSFFVKLLNFLRFGSGNCRSRFSKSFYRDGLSRPVSVDILNFQNCHTNFRADLHRAASISRRAGKSTSCLYVSDFESQNYLQKIRFQSKQLKVVTRLKIACQDFFEIFFSACENIIKNGGSLSALKSSICRPR
jgi:hypothetical protein